MIDELTRGGYILDPDDGFIGHVGGMWRRIVDTQPEFAFIARDFHANRNGFVHGGMLVTFVDRAMGQTARHRVDATRGATVNLNSQFLAPARIGDLVKVVPQITAITARMVFISGTVMVGAVPVLSAQGIYRVSHSKV